MTYKQKGRILNWLMVLIASSYAGAMVYALTHFPENALIISALCGASSFFAGVLIYMLTSETYPRLDGVP